MSRFNIGAFGEILFDVYPDSKRIGGAPFNFIYHIFNLTGTGSILTRIGKDKSGKDLVNFLHKNKMDDSFVQADPVHPTGRVNVTLDTNKIPSFNIENNAAYDHIEYNRSFDKFLSPGNSLLYFGTLAQRNPLSCETLQRLWGKDIIYYCDLNLREGYYNDQIISDTIDNCTILKLSLDELETVCRLANIPGTSEKVKVENILMLKNIKVVCLTRGRDGATVYSREGNFTSSQETDKLTDTTGAGDSYSAVFALGYLKKLELEKINEAAVWFATQACSYSGALPKDDKLYKKFLKRFPAFQS